VLTKKTIIIFLLF